jgi:hypothetical protein
VCYALLYDGEIVKVTDWWWDLYFYKIPFALWSPERVMIAYKEGNDLRPFWTI